MSDVRVVKSENFYDVRGTTREQLRAAMRAGGPGGWYGYTQWTASWKPSSRLVMGTHSVVDPNVALTVKTTFPRWVDRSSAPPALQKSWDGFMTGLRTHEAGHSANGLQGARDAQAAINQLGFFKSKAAMDAAVNGAAQVAIFKANAADRAYDARTRHGASQGAAF